MTQIAATPAEPTPASSPRKPASAWQANLLLVLGVSFLLLAITGGTIAWRYYQRHRVLADVQAELARIRAAGEPITPADMHRYHQEGPRSAEKASAWLKAFQAIPEIENDSDENNALFAALGAASPLVGDELRQAEAMLQKRSAAFRLAAEAAKIDGDARFPIEFEDGLNAYSEHNFEFHKAMRWFALRHRVAVSRGDTQRAIESLHLMLATGEALKFQPQLISQIMRGSNLHLLRREISFLLDNLELTDEQMADLQSRLASLDFQQSFRRGLLGERADGYHAFHFLIEEEPDKLDGKKKAAPGVLRRPADFRYYLDAMSQLLAAAERSLPDARQKALEVDASVKRIQTQQTGSRAKRHEFVGSAELLPGTIGSIDIWANAECGRDSAVAAIAFRRYQLAHGKPPESLAALCPQFLAAVPQDPYANSPAPLKLVLADDRFAIYSVGTNQTDDRALLADAKSVEDTGVVVRLALPSQRPSSAATSSAGKP